MTCVGRACWLGVLGRRAGSALGVPGDVAASSVGKVADLAMDVVGNWLI